MLEYKNLSLNGVKLIYPKKFSDGRGFFMETYNINKFSEIGIMDTFVQDNCSRSSFGTIRGLHYQSSPGQAKLIRVIQGRIFDVFVDIRPQSPTFKQWGSVELSARSNKQLYIPCGFAHGFCVIDSWEAEINYKVSSVYDPETEETILWNDPEIGIVWPVDNPILSERDLNGELLCKKHL